MKRRLAKGAARSAVMFVPLLALLVLWNGCAVNEVERMKQAADVIAKGEIQKFNQLELPYKDQVFFASIGAILPELDFGNGMFIKRYRQFTGYQLKDIVKTDSIMAPYILVIEYSYDYFMTPPRDAKSKQDAEARGLCEKDTQYTVDKQHLIRRYHCDAKGNFVGKISDLPPLENVYSHGGVQPETSVMQGAQ